MTTTRPMPTITGTEVVGPFLNITVETPWPVPILGDSMQEAVLYQWAQDNLPAWARYEPVNPERTEWLFICEDWTD